MKAIKYILAASVLMVASHTTLAQQSAEPQRATSEIEKPQRGMHKDDVVAHFGKPQQWSNAIGQPPITVWRYPGFSVYFEYNHVIHAVKHQP